MRQRFSGSAVVSIASILLWCGPVAARGAEFDSIVRTVQQESGCHRIHIPFFWLARTVVAVGHPAGTSELKLAVFERPSVAPERFGEIVDDALGPFWKPMVRVRSKDGEVTSIFLRENGGQTVRLLIATKDRDDAVLVQVRLNVDRLLRFIDEHQQFR
jgi:hypothetical protein